MNHLIAFDNYNLSGDVATIAICFVVVVLLKTSYVSRTRNYRIFQNIIFSIWLAATVNIIYHSLPANGGSAAVIAAYVLRVLYQAFLLDIFFLFALYATEASQMDHKSSKSVALVCITLMTAALTIDIVRSIIGVGFRITEDGTVVNSSNIYMIAYVIFVIILAVLMARIRQLVYKRVLIGFYATMALAVIIRFIQMALNMASLTTLTFTFPVVAMLYYMHSNPYNITSGTLDTRAMEDMIRTMHSKKEDFVFLSLLLTEFDDEGKELPERVRALTRRFSVEYFKKCYVFQFSNGHMVLIAPKHRNTDYEKRIEGILGSFAEYYEQFKYPYKIVIGEAIEDISVNNEYTKLIRSVERAIPDNTIRKIGAEDIARFKRDEYIIHELTDIYKKRDMDDPRVLAYCQPVFNTATGQFDTAEALMRLDLKGTGILQPIEFIPLAEGYGFIHVLTDIILNKTCRELKKMTDEGFRIKRISVNVSVIELKEDDFCDDIVKIIENNRLSGDMIAIELTESESEADFNIMKEKIEELKKQGIQFYLDDFGTGYSNMQRIMALPFDLIKFDRSMVLASGMGERSEKIVENLAQIFKEMQYAILYEGIESKVDEERCLEMSATYLQGFKYSVPVPIEELRRFLKKVG